MGGGLGALATLAWERGLTAPIHGVLDKGWEELGEGARKGGGPWGLQLCRGAGLGGSRRPGEEVVVDAT